MLRAASKDLEIWLNKSERKPLVIRGARQVGKTWMVRDLARQKNKLLLEINFEKSPSLVSIFDVNDPREILLSLEAVFDQTIDINNTILFLDEIQAAPEVFAKLRWFAEELPQLPVIAAGSLLDFMLGDHAFSMPVGRISYLYLEPMSFQEFLVAMHKDKLVDFLQNFELGDVIPVAIHDKLWGLLKEYLVVGGLPEAVKNWMESRSLMDISAIHNDLLATYRDDFNKYAGRVNRQRLEEVLTAVPKSLGQKFKYVNVNRDAQTVSIKHALSLLCQARICNKVYGCSGNGVPLLAEIKDKIFKVVFLDIGLVSALLGLSLQSFALTTDVAFVNQGKLAEQLVGQLLRTINPRFIEPTLYYWSREQKGSEAEVDYLIQYGDKVVPIEVKAGSTGTLKSLHVFMSEKGLKTAIRLNSDQASVMQVKTKVPYGKVVEYKLISIPIYLVEQISRLLK